MTMTVMTLTSPWPRGPRIGVDVVPVDRIERAGESDVRRFACGPRDFAVGTLHQTAATWAVKEAAIKVMGGRPPGFSWPAIAVSHHRESTGRLGRLLGDALMDGVHGSGCRWCEYEWLLPSQTARGLAAWCVANNAVWALAIEIPVNSVAQGESW